MSTIKEIPILVQSHLQIQSAKLLIVHKMVENVLKLFLAYIWKFKAFFFFSQGEFLGFK